METGLAEDGEEFQEALQASPLCIGSEGFRERDLLAGRACLEDVACRRMDAPLDSAEVLEVLARGLSVGIAVSGAAVSRKRCGNAARDRRIFGMRSGATASAQAGNYDRWLDADPKFAKIAQKLDQVLARRKAETKQAK